MLPKHVLNIPCIETACLQLEWIIELVNIFLYFIWDLKLSFLSNLLTYLVNLLFKNSKKKLYRHNLHVHDSGSSCIGMDYWSCNITTVTQTKWLFMSASNTCIS